MIALPGIADFFFKAPAPGGLGDLAKSKPVTTIAPTYKPAPGGGATVAKFEKGGAGKGAAAGAAQGFMVGGPVGAGIGAGIGALFGGLSKPSSTGKGSGLTDAFAEGLGSLGIPGIGGSQPMQVTQTQAVDQTTNVNVSNVLGGRTFGGVTESGDFDTFQAISDVFKIRDAMNQSGQPAVASTTPAEILNQAAQDYRPYILIGAAALAFFLIMRR